MTPSAMPSIPMRLPWTMKMDNMLRGEEPKVRKIAISRRLLFTTITMVDTMLNAATATTADSMMKRMRFVISIERKKFACCVVQSSTRYLPPSAPRVVRDSGDIVAHAQQLGDVLHGDE